MNRPDVAGRQVFTLAFDGVGGGFLATVLGGPGVGLSYYVKDATQQVEWTPQDSD